MQQEWAEDEQSERWNGPCLGGGAAGRQLAPLRNRMQTVADWVIHHLVAAAECTFILLDPDFPDSPGTGTHGGAMAGDVNLVRRRDAACLLPQWVATFSAVII